MNRCQKGEHTKRGAPLWHMGCHTILYLLRFLLSLTALSYGERILPLTDRATAQGPVTTILHRNIYSPIADVLLSPVDSTQNYLNTTKYEFRSSETMALKSSNVTIGIWKWCLAWHQREKEAPCSFCFSCFQLWVSTFRLPNACPPPWKETNTFAKCGAAYNGLLCNKENDLSVEERNANEDVVINLR